jgi:large subunit ribosomal protein L18
MATINQSRGQYRERRHNRVRSRILGTSDRPRLVVFKSLRNISAQIINDVLGVTLAAANNRDVKEHSGATVDLAHAVGKLLADRAKIAKVTQVVFDRGGNAYHGQVKALAEGARDGGLEF